jgi:hypothetical protein
MVCWIESKQDVKQLQKCAFYKSSGIKLKITISRTTFKSSLHPQLVIEYDCRPIRKVYPPYGQWGF